MSEDRVQVKVGANGVATVTMVRAGKHNALDRGMFDGLTDAAARLGHRGRARSENVIV